MYIKLFFAVISFLSCFGPLMAADTTASAEEILAKADAIRNPSESYFLDVLVDSTENPSEPHEFLVAIDGNTKTRIETIHPKRDKGRNLLMLDENMWVFIPNLKREVRVGLNQKLVGEAANGDISRMRWSGDYTPTITSQSDNEWELLLVAKKKGLSYDRIKVWIDKQTFRPLRAEYLTGAGKLLKQVTYQGYKSIAGGIRPTEIIIQDSVRQGDQSKLTIKEMRVRKFPSSIFNKNELDSQHLQ